MKTLAFDTAVDSVSVALLDGTQVIDSCCQKMERGQGEALIPMIDTLMAQNTLSWKEVGQIAVSVGPGSFTGVRIGLAAARGFGLALGIPVLGTSTLEAHAYQRPGDLLVALDTKRGDFYTQLFQDGQATEEPKIRTLGQIKALSVPSVFCETDDSCPAVLVGLSALHYRRPPEPIYLREADVTL